MAWFGWALLFCGALAGAQNTNATIRGQVVDPSGALVAGARIDLVNRETGVVVFAGRTDRAGSFVAAQVLPGTYRLQVQAAGLKRFALDGLVATVAQVATVQVALELGPATETVTVRARGGGEELDRGTSNLSTLIAPGEVAGLPLQQRQTENLLSLIAGAAHGGPGDAPNTIQLSIDGSRTLNTEVLLDGVSVITAPNGTPVTLPSPDGVDSFRVITANAPAEYGRTSGAVISVNTIAGTNVYHGNAYFLIRNEAFDANQYFHKDTIDTTTGAVLPRNRDRFFQAGGSLGGPVRIPHAYNGRDRTFFFVNFDRTILPVSTTLTDTVPTTAQRIGDFSLASAPVGSTGLARTPQVIYMPNGPGSMPFAGNRVGPIDPAAAKILALLPLPNTAGAFDPVNNRYTGNYTSLQNLTGHTDKTVVRFDEAIRAGDRLGLHAYHYTTATPNAVNYQSALLNTTYDCACSQAWLGEVEYTHTWSPTLVVDWNLGYFRNVILRHPPGAGLGAGARLGIASLPLDQAPELIDAGFSNIGADTNTDQVNITNTYTPFGSVTKVVGTHTLKAGASLRKNEFNSFNPATSPEGTISFDGSITNRGATGNPNTGIADFLLGKIKTASYEQPQPETGRRNYNFGLFVQDDWRASSKLTVDVGLRYEYESPITIANNIYSRIDPATGVLLVAGQNASRSLNVDTPKGDVSPRLGLALSLNDKTVVRAAFGTFYGTIFQNLGGQVAFPGYDNTVSYNNLGTGVAQPFSLSQGLPLAAAPDLANPGAALANSSAANPYTVGISFNDQRHLSLVQQYNLGLERQLPLGLTLEVNYAGNHGLHLPYVIGENQVPLAAVPAVTLANTSLAMQNSLPFPRLKPFTVDSNLGGSSYHSLQVTLRRQFNTRLALLANYTYAKAEDDASSIYNFSAPNGTANSQYPVDGPDRIKDVAPSSLDIKHALNVALVYTTAGPWYLRGFHLSPLLVVHGGLPVNITQTAEVPGAAQRPNGNAQAVRLAHPFQIAGSPNYQYFDSPATDTNFPLTASGPVYNTINGVRTLIVASGFGNVSRNSNRAPGELDFDLSVARDFRLFSRVMFQFRVDGFNVVNHTNFMAPNTVLSVQESGAAPSVASFAGSTGFGRITGTQPNRALQLSSRVWF